MPIYETFLTGNSPHLEEFRKFAIEKTSDCFFGFIVRPNSTMRDTWIKANIFMTEEEANFVKLKFGAHLRIMNET